MVNYYTQVTKGRILCRLINRKPSFMKDEKQRVIVYKIFIGLVLVKDKITLRHYQEFVSWLPDLNGRKPKRIIS